MHDRRRALRKAQCCDSNLKSRTQPTAATLGPMNRMQIGDLDHASAAEAATRAVPEAHEETATVANDGPPLRGCLLLRRPGIRGEGNAIHGAAHVPADHDLAVASARCALEPAQDCLATLFHGH